MATQEGLDEQFTRYYEAITRLNVLDVNYQNIESQIPETPHYFESPQAYYKWNKMVQEIESQLAENDRLASKWIEQKAEAKKNLLRMLPLPMTWFKVTCRYEGFVTEEFGVAFIQSRPEHDSRSAYDCSPHIIYAAWYKAVEEPVWQHLGWVGKALKYTPT